MSWVRAFSWPRHGASFASCLADFMSSKTAQDAHLSGSFTFYGFVALNTLVIVKFTHVGDRSMPALRISVMVVAFNDPLDSRSVF